MPGVPANEDEVGTALPKTNADGPDVGGKDAVTNVLPGPGMIGI